MTKSTNYMGNANLLRIGVKKKWTAEQLEEYIKCKSDPIYFVEKYMKIVNLDGGLIPFQMYEYQKKMLRSFYTNRQTIAKLPRQAGKTSTYCAYCLHYITFNDFKKVAILANKKETALQIIERIQLAFESLPMFLKHGVLEYNKGRFVLENHSEVFASATSSNAIRGFSANTVIIDEVAAIENWDKFYVSTYPVISSGKTSTQIFVGTPAGLNHFWKFWKEANEKDPDNPQTSRNGFVPIEINWWDTPGRDEDWKKHQLKVFSQEEFNQEYNTEFIGSSSTLIAPKKLKELTWSTPIDHDTQFDIRIFEKPEKFGKYVISVDTSRGTGIDSSAFSIFDITQSPFKQVVAMNNADVFPHEFAEIIYTWGKRYNSAYALIENNDAGGQVGDLLYLEHDYERVFFSEAMGRDGLALTFSGGSKRAKSGINTNKRTKRIGCITLKNLVEGNELFVHDERTVTELMNFIRVKDSYQADPNVHNSHDDLVMTMVLFSYLVNSPIFKELVGTDFKKPTRYRDDEDYFPDMAKMLREPVTSNLSTWTLVENHTTPSPDVVSRIKW